MSATLAHLALSWYELSVDQRGLEARDPLITVSWRSTSAANRLIGEVAQSRRRPLGPLSKRLSAFGLTLPADVIYCIWTAPKGRAGWLA